MKKILTLFALLIAFAVNGFADDTWTVAGSAAVFGSNWNPSDTNNDMTYDSGTGKWTLTKNNVTLTAGVTYEYKVVKNHSWDNENYGVDGTSGGSNKTFFVEESASYNVTITFDYNNGITLTESYVKVGTAQNAEITKVEVRGATTQNWEESSKFYLTLNKQSDFVYTGILDLSATTNDAWFKLVINEASWIGYNALTVAEGSIALSGEGGNGSNFILANSDGVYKTYTVTATWVEGTDATAGWTLKIEGKDLRVEPDAEITSVQLMGDGVQPWTTNAFNVTLTKDGENNRWTGTLDLSNSALDQTFKLVVNGGGDESDGWKGWIGTNNLAISNTTPTGWVLATSENPNENCTLYNSITGYKTYTLTAEWVPSSDYAAGWTLTIAGKDRRDYYVIGGNGEGWTVLGKMNYYEPMDEYDYVMDKSTSTFTGKYFAIAPESALNAAKDGVEDWSKVVRPVTTSGNYLVELIQYDGTTTSGANANQVVWELADDITDVGISYYLTENKFRLLPKSEVTITSAGYATYSNKYAYQISKVSDEVEVSIVKEVTTEAVLTELPISTNVDDKNIPAGTGVIVKGTGSFVALPYGTNGFMEYVDVTGNMLIGSNNDTYNITGTYPSELGGGKYTAYVLKEINSKVGFYKVNDTDRNLAAHKAFLAVPETSTAPAFIIIGGGEGTTGINDLRSLTEDASGNIYDLQGRRVENPTKGIYIVNGHKVVIK